MNPEKTPSAPQTDHKILSLNITEQCNLACTYCYQVERRNNKRNLMSFEVATSAIADHLTRDDAFRSVVIEFIGGEVLLYWAFVRDLITWTAERRSRWTKEFSFFLDTNGTLLTDEIKNFFSDRCDFVTVGLSLDGTPEAHDLNRPNSYARIAPHLQFFADTWPLQPVKMTISPRTIPMIFDGIVHIMRHGIPVSSNLPMEDIYGQPDERTSHVQAYRREIEKLVDFFSAHPELPLPSLIDLPIAVIGSEEEDRPWCGSGRNMVAIETGGRELPCNRYASMSFDQSLFGKPLSIVKSKCQVCAFRAACQTCEALNWEVHGNPADRTTFHCDFIRLQIWATANVHAARLEKRVSELLGLSPKERAPHIEELVRIRAHLTQLESILEEFDKHHKILDAGMPPGWRERVECGELRDDVGCPSQRS